MLNTAFRRPWAAGIAGLFLICLTAAPRIAAAQDAAAFIANLGNEAIQVSGPSVPPAQRAARFRQIIERDFDLPDIARFVLGHYSHDLSPEQQQEFPALLRESLVQTYTTRLSAYAGEPFRVTGSHPSGGETVVTSQVQRRSDAPVEIDWHVTDRGGRPLITDVYIDGVSMKAARRSEFAGIIQRNGGRPDALVAVLRQQVAQAR